MSDITTIQVEKRILKELKKAKKYPRQTYSDLIDGLLKTGKQNQKQYDKFLHAIQQEKMKELWDNKEDEEWEHA